MLALHRRLRKTQGQWSPGERLDPLDELIAVLLSQHTSDVNSARAFRNLKSRFPSWEEVADAPVDEIADAIRSGGIANLKARRIKQVLAEIERSEGRLDLERLRHLSDEDARAFLLALPGVGPKSAACVLQFSLGRPAFPVDTHVHRVAKRLGLVDERASAEAAAEMLEPRIAPEIRHEFHVQLIRHGREICKPQIPRCSECPLFDLCAAGPRLLSEGAAR
ncbi:MAG TPA: endonuclease III [Actinomycetota bacterium]|nr:endonuclease III [Actinomycetota bacterium]